MFHFEWTSVTTPLRTWLKGEKVENIYSALDGFVGSLIDQIGDILVGNVVPNSVRVCN